MALYIVGTPIGNLKDITTRAVETLARADIVLAEDTRVAKKLLDSLSIQKPIMRYDEHSHESVCKKIGTLLASGKEIALVTDAGTPGISDPCSRLIAYIREVLPSVSIIPLPGPSAVVTALSASGIQANEFTFLGYPPHKKGRETFFEALIHISVRPLVLYESPHRLQKTFSAIQKSYGAEKEIIVAKELTKIHEEIWHGTAGNASQYFEKEKGKGEFVIIIP